MSNCKGLLSLQADEISPWSFEAKVEKKSLNRYKINKMIYPMGTRKYLELKHLEESIFVGRWGQSAVVVPTEDYVRHVLGNFESNGNECLVQLNLSKNLKSIDYKAQSENGEMSTQAKFLDTDGIFYSDVSDATNRAFIFGEGQGIINIKLEYTDGSKQFMQTFCSDSTYLVEQL